MLNVSSDNAYLYTTSKLAIDARKVVRNLYKGKWLGR